MKKILLVVLFAALLCIVKHSAASDYAFELMDELQTTNTLRMKTISSLDFQFAVACKVLKQNGYKKEAQKLQDEWQNQWMAVMRATRDLGDHKPLNEWIAKKYKELVELLGQDVVNFFHLDDINIINYAIPVVFNCHIAYNETDYSQHFVPLSGVIAYWGAAGTCILVSSGIGVFFCSPIGMVSEHLMIKFIAPGISVKVYNRFCGSDVEELQYQNFPVW